MNSTEIMDAVNSALDEKKLNFIAELRPVFYKDDNGDSAKTNLFVPVRTDDGSVIADRTFTRAYHPIQNRDAFSVIGEIANLADIDFVNVGSWGNGAGVYAQIALGDDISVGGNDDRVGRYLSIVNSHDGSRGCTVLITPYRFWCRNQIAPAIRHADDGAIISIRHDARAQDRLNELAQTVHVCDRVFHRSATLYNRLAETKVTMEHVREAMAQSLPYVEIKDLGEPSPFWCKALEHMVTRFKDADYGRGERMTGWNLYNAIQGTFQHDSRHTAAYQHSVLCGGIADKSAKALRTVERLLLNENGFVTTDHPEFDNYFDQLVA